MWESNRVAFAKNHRLNAAEDSSECDSQCNQEKWSGPGVLPHGSCENEKSAGKNANRRHSKNRQRPKHKPPANSWAGSHQSSNAVHLLCTGLLRSVPCRKEDGRLRK